jgi:hypothetical protein|nr:hypothetical protein [uncultured Thiodictyon sp.]
MVHERFDAHQLRHRGHTKNGIAQQCLADAVALPRKINRQAPKQHDGNRVRHIPPDTSGRLFAAY